MLCIQTKAWPCQELYEYLAKFPKSSAARNCVLDLGRALRGCNAQAGEVAEKARVGLGELAGVGDGVLNTLAAQE